MPSVLVAVTVSVKSASLSAGGVMVSAARSQSETSTVVSPGAAVKLFVPSVSVAPSGMSESSVVSTSLPSRSVSADSRLSAIAVSSSPAVGAVIRIGASATGLTTTLRGAVVTAVTVPSVLVAVTVSVKSASLSAGGVMVSAARSQSETSTVVSPGAAVKLLVPSVSVAPAGIAAISVARLSLASRSVRDEVISSAIALSSSPTAGAVVTTGASATGLTVTSSGAVVTAISVPSVLVAVTTSEKSASLSAGGVIVSAESVQSETSTVVSLRVAVNTLVPSVSVAPAGIAAISVTRLSLPSTSVRADSRLRAIGVSSSPVAGAVITMGASAIGLMTTSIVSVLTAVSPLLSVLVAVTVSAKSASLSAGGVTVRAERSQSETSTVVSPGAAVKLLVPSVRTTPSGMSETSVTTRSLPSMSVELAARDRAIALSSSPIAGATDSAGASATGVSATGSVPTVVAVSVPSVLVAVSVSVKSSPESGVGVMRMEGKNQSETSTAVLPADAVKLLVPSVSVAPSGMSERIVAKVSLPSISLSAASRSSAINASSSLPAAGLVMTVGASATGFTVTSSGSLNVLVFGPSLLTAVTVRMKSSSRSLGGTICRLVIFQVVISTESDVEIDSKTLLPSVSVAPTGIPERMVCTTSLPSISTAAVESTKSIALSSSPFAG